MYTRQDFEKSAQMLMQQPGDFSAWEFYLGNTAQWGDYPVFSHVGREHLRSQFIRDVEALAVFFKNELKLQAQDCFTIFMPTNAEGLIAFFALNKIGVIVNFIHPLLSSDKVSAIMDFTGSKGVMLLDLFVPGNLELLKKKGVPAVIVNPKQYAYPDCIMCPREEKTAAMLSDAGVEHYGWSETVAKYAGQSVENIPHGLKYVCVYMNGGGTTGESRTIMLSNTAINNQVYMLGSPDVPTEPDRVGVDTEICAMPFFHAFGLCAGGLSAINLGHKGVFLSKFDAEAFVRLMKENCVSEFNGVPNMYKKLVATPSFDCDALANVKKMYSGGDLVSQELCDKMYALLRKHGSDAEFCAGYGLTECCAACVVNPLWKNKFGTIGLPLPGLRVEIWDDHKNKLPYNTVGEIAISGPIVMDGYLTEAREKDVGVYIDDEGVRWVLTGDLGKMDEDAYITFIGRKKRVIIISGYNVYPVDIERLVEPLPFVKECCAVQGFEGKSPIIRLFIVPSEADGERSAQDTYVRSLIAEKLNRFSVPRDIRYIDALPRTKLEKIDFMSLSEFEPKKI